MLLNILALEPHGEGLDWLWPPGDKGDGVPGAEEVCAQRSGSTELHVSAKVGHHHMKQHSAVSYLPLVEYNYT